MFQNKTVRSVLLWRSVALVFSVFFLSACSGAFEASDPSSNETALGSDTQTPPTAPPPAPTPTPTPPPTPEPTPPPLVKTREYRIQSDLSKLCLKSSNGASTQGACDSASLVFEEFKDSAGLLELRIKGTSLCLGIAKSSSVNTLNAPMAYETCEGSARQKFKIETTSAGQLKFIPEASKMCINISASSMAVGAAIIQWTCGSYANQLFNLASAVLPTQPPPEPTPPPEPIPTPTPVPTPPSGSTAAMIEVARSQMRNADNTLAKNDGLLAGRNTGSSQYRGASIVMGNYGSPLAFTKTNPNYNETSWIVDAAANNADYQKLIAWPNWRGILHWNQLYRPTTGHLSGFVDNTRVQMRNAQLWVKRRSTGQWIRLSKSNDIGGAAMNPNFGDIPNVTWIYVDSRAESEGVSVRHLPESQYGINIFHGWAGGIREIDGTDIAAVWSSIETRLILHNPSGKDDRDSARYLMGCGADYYPNTTKDRPFYLLPGVGTSRHTLVSKEWKTCVMHTMNYDQVSTEIPAMRALELEMVEGK